MERHKGVAAMLLFPGPNTCRGDAVGERGATRIVWELPGVERGSPLYIAQREAEGMGDLPRGVEKTLRHPDRRMVPGGRKTPGPSLEGYCLPPGALRSPGQTSKNITHRQRNI